MSGIYIKCQVCKSSGEKLELPDEHTASGKPGKINILHTLHERVNELRANRSAVKAR